MNKTLKLWCELFGNDQIPNDGEIIGVEPDGTLLYYNAQTAVIYNDGRTVDAIDDGESGKMNEREHIVTHPLQYVALLRMHLKNCSTPDMDLKVGSIAKLREGIALQKARLKEINDTVEFCLCADPNKFVSNLSKEMEYQIAKHK